MSRGRSPFGWLVRVWRLLRPPRRLRFTREGRYFVAIAIGIGLAAINTGNNLLYLLLGWLLSVIVASGVLSEVTMRGLIVRRRAPTRIFANQPFLMEISVANDKGSLASYSIEIEDLNDGKPLDKKCFFLKVPPGRTQRTSYRHRFSKRGLYTFSGFRIGTKFPFALFRKTRTVDEADDMVVYPTVYPVATPAPNARYSTGNLAAQIGRSGEFFGLREYRHGDDRRDIHWRSSARSGRVLVREYQEEAQKRVTLLIDNALPPPAAGQKPAKSAKSAKLEDADVEALERAISLCASLAAAYLGAGYSVALLARGAQLPFSAGQPQLMRILRTLALLPPVTGATPFTQVPNARIESVLVIPRGVAPQAGRPTEVSHITQAH
jgi:uncharacterized protein (DUF58 family)